MRKYWLKLYRHDFNFFLPSYWLGTVDGRPASLFRILFAAVILKDAIYHVFIANDFFSDEGVYPRDVMLEIARDNRFSLMDAMEKGWMAQAFFLLWVAVLIGLLVGYRTRLMAILNFIIIVSVHERNIYILNGADTVFRVFSFWAMFITMGEYYSVDALRRRWSLYEKTRNVPDLRAEDEPRTIFALPIRLIQIQIAIVYLFTFLLKYPDRVWREGEGLFYALQVRSLVLPTGDWFLEHMPMGAHYAGDYFTLFMEATFFVFVFLPFIQPFLRGLALTMGFMMHFGIAILMSVPNFSVGMVASYGVFFLPEWVVWIDNLLRKPRVALMMPNPPVGSPLWMPLSMTRGDEIALGDFPPDDYLQPNNRTAITRDSWVVMDRDSKVYQGQAAWQAVAAHMPLSRLWAWVLAIPAVRALLWWLGGIYAGSDAVQPQRCDERTPDREFEWFTMPARVVVSVALVGMMVVTVWWNLNTVKTGEGDDRVVDRVEGTPRAMYQYLGLWQGWSMFAPHPSTADGWITVPAVFENGLEIDLITQKPETEEWTQWYWGPESRWKKYVANLRRNKNTKMLSAMGSYYCRIYNTVGGLPEGERLATLEIHYHFVRSHAPGEPENSVSTTTLWRHWCYSEYKY